MRTESYETIISNKFIEHTQIQISHPNKEKKKFDFIKFNLIFHDDKNIRAELKQMQ